MIDKSEMNELREHVEDLLDNQIRDWELVRTNTYALASLKTRYLYIRDTVQSGAYPFLCC